MEVILLERIDKLGQMGDVVKVKNGFARNFLLPRKKALRANKTNRKYFEDKRAELEAVNLKRKDEALSVASKMEGLHIIIVRQASEAGQLYGSVSSRDITAALKEQGIKIEKGQIDLNSPVKELGKYSIPVKLHPEVEIEISITVSRSEELSENDIEGQNNETNDINLENSSKDGENKTNNPNNVEK
ncbi:MAG: 50S ribosomal protein L9 [Pseudomonadota bacterium]|nr:50S ribosomal protein L9 [Pseudomonadota bacterium]